MTQVKSETEVKSKKSYQIGHRCFYFSKEVVLFVKSCNYQHVFSSLFD